MPEKEGLFESVGSETVAEAQAALKEDIAELKSILHGLLDRLNGTKLTFTDGGFRLNIPPATPSNPQY